MQLFLPRVNGAGHSVGAVVHGVRGPAVAPHTLSAVVSGHSQVLGEEESRRKRYGRERRGLTAIGRQIEMGDEK